MTDFWKEIAQGVRCIKLVQQLLREEEKMLDFLQERGSSTNSTKFKIDRMKYALGEISIPPHYKDYFPQKHASEE